MTRVTHNGRVYLKINKEEWEFSGGETNPDLLKLKNRRVGSRGFCYFKLREGINLDMREHEDAAQYSW